MKKAGIISVGNEILAGQILDSNSGYLSRQLLSCGIRPVGFWAVGDEVGRIAGAIEQAVEESDVVLITGGLGPTDDDLTRKALAEFMGTELEFRAALLDTIRSFFQQRGLEMSEKNKVQAYIPAGAESLSNNVGTAPGIIAEHKDRLIVCLPGPPVEMKRMFEESVVDKVKALG